MKVEEKKSGGETGGPGEAGGDDYSLGLAFYQTDMLDEALPRFEKSLGRRDRLESSLFYIGMIHYRRGDYPAAIRSFKKLLEENPENLVAYNNLAVTFEGVGMIKEAELLYQEARKISPLASQVLANVGILMYRRERYKEAEEYLRRAVQLNRNMAFAYFYLGMTCLKLSMWDEAQGHLEQCLQLSPDNPIVFNNLGIFYRMTGDFNRGIRYSLAALELDDRIPGPYRNIDEIFCQIGEWEQCLKSIDEAVPEVERNLRLLVTLGDHYFSKGDYEMAHKMWKRGLEVDPGNAAITEKLGMLRNIESE